MLRSMVHPYLGYLVTCAECDGLQHDEKHAYAATRWEMCDGCGDALESCITCGVYITCCVQCGAHHAYECPWPL